ncbi:hypothetical protein Bca101_075955 [Brassica carinata]
MKETLRCCIACILPCGALDVIRIVHSNGYVEEISGTITASEVMKAHPKHVLKKPSSPPSSDHDDVISATKIVIVPPEAELQRGKIYFLMPATKPDKEKIRRDRSNANAVKKRSRHHREDVDDHKSNGENNGKDKDSSVLISDRPAIALYAEQEVDKLEPLNENLPSDFQWETSKPVSLRFLFLRYVQALVLLKQNLQLQQN